MTPAHPLYDLLHDWSNHEPDRVLLTIGSTIAVRVQGNAFGVSMPGVALAAVIEAITARSWEWGVSYERLDDGTFLHIAYVIRPDDKPGGTAEHPDLTTALLTAYLAALDAEASQ